jgi:hypothetical protein
MWDRTDLDVTPQIIERRQGCRCDRFRLGVQRRHRRRSRRPRRPIKGIDGDRDAIELPEIQTKLIQALAETGKPLVIVNFGGGATAMSWEAEHVSAIAQAWYPAKRARRRSSICCSAISPRAVVCPSLSIARSSDLPAFDDYAMNGRTYRFFIGKPLWAFGHGLSYTTFEYRSVRVEMNQASRSRSTWRTRTARRRRSGATLRAESNSAIPMSRGASSKPFAVCRSPTGRPSAVTLSIPTSSLRHWDVQRHEYVVDPGEYELQIGSASDDIRCERPSSFRREVREGLSLGFRAADNPIVNEGLVVGALILDRQAHLAFAGPIPVERVVIDDVEVNRLFLVIAGIEKVMPVIVVLMRDHGPHADSERRGPLG